MCLHWTYNIAIAIGSHNSEYEYFLTYGSLLVNLLIKIEMIIFEYILNSHPAKAPHMAPLVMHYNLFRNRSWGWSSGIVCVPSLARRGFETACNDFFIFALVSIAEIPR